jgi:uncharacterized membrane protein YfcA
VRAGATAAIAGFGIGSLLTPLLATQLGTRLAVAAVAIPHAVASALRAWRLRAAIDWPVLRRFGVLSAAGGLVGGFLYARLANRVLTAVLGALLIATAVAGVTGWTTRWHPGGRRAHLLGILSGLFGVPPNRRCRAALMPAKFEGRQNRSAQSLALRDSRLNREVWF